MPKRKSAGASEWVDPDDAPELTDEFFDNAEIFQGDTFVRRGPGRPRSAATKEQISVRLDPEVLAKLRGAGPGWQSEINVLLRRALGLDQVDAAAQRHVKAADLPEMIRTVYTTFAGIAEAEPITRKKSGKSTSPLRTTAGDKPVTRKKTIHPAITSVTTPEGR